jgi:hypothetical protein
MVATVRWIRPGPQHTDRLRQGGFGGLAEGSTVGGMEPAGEVGD